MGLVFLELGASIAVSSLLLARLIAWNQIQGDRIESLLQEERNHHACVREQVLIDNLLSGQQWLVSQRQQPLMHSTGRILGTRTFDECPSAPRGYQIIASDQPYGSRDWPNRSISYVAR